MPFLRADFLFAAMADGKVVETRAKNFKHFAGNWSNHLILAPQEIETCENAGQENSAKE